MAGTWLAIVEGFGGMRVNDDKLTINPLIPGQWKSFSFHARFRGILFEVEVNHKEIIINNLSEKNLTMVVHGTEYLLAGSEIKSVKLIPH
jgi:maltose phosphorylase